MTQPTQSSTPRPLDERREWWTRVRDACPESKALGEAMLRVIAEEERCQSHS